METRIAELEAEVAAIKIDLATIKAHGATNTNNVELKRSFSELKGSISGDMAELRGAVAVNNAELKGLLVAEFAEMKGLLVVDIAETKASITEAKTSMIMWVVSSIFLAQLLPILAKMLMD
jgi:uncharacterized small protein (DUF1192 family)